MDYLLCDVQIEEDIQRQYSRKVVSLRDTKTKVKTEARKQNKQYSTAQREWLNASERKTLLAESLSNEMK